jgi:hypothetical protein
LRPHSQFIATGLRGISSELSRARHAVCCLYRWSNAGTNSGDKNLSRKDNLIVSKKRQDFASIDMRIVGTPSLPDDTA